jgi:hypothetical protein
MYVVIECVLIFLSILFSLLISPPFSEEKEQEEERCVVVHGCRILSSRSVIVLLWA